jgi:cellobiose-specific phosphotransferase system component IIC
MKNRLKRINQISMSVLTYLSVLTFDYIKTKENILALGNFLDLKAIFAAIIVFLLVTWIYYSAKVYVKQINKEMVSAIENRYKAFTESFSSWFLYTSAISEIVNEKIIKQMPEEEQAKILHEGKFLIDYLDRFGFDEKVKDEMKRMYHEDELKKLNKNE